MLDTTSQIKVLKSHQQMGELNQSNTFTTEKKTALAVFLFLYMIVLTK